MKTVRFWDRKMGKGYNRGIYSEEYGNSFPFENSKYKVISLSFELKLFITISVVALSLRLIILLL